ncbi:unnamed protein product, partial [Choristocarpus tenellus]
MLQEDGRRYLRGWLQKNLAPHVGSDSSSLIDYIVAIVGNADEPDDDLRERWTEKLDDFLGDSSADFVEQLLNAVRSGNYGNSAGSAKSGHGGGVGVESGGGNGTISKDAPIASPQVPVKQQAQQTQRKANVVKEDLEDSEGSDEDSDRQRRRRGQDRGDSGNGTTVATKTTGVISNSRSVTGNRAPKRPRGDSTGGGGGGRGMGAGAR